MSGNTAAIATTVGWLFPNSCCQITGFRWLLPWESMQTHRPRLPFQKQRQLLLETGPSPQIRLLSGGPEESTAPFILLQPGCRCSLRTAAFFFILSLPLWGRSAQRVKPSFRSILSEHFFGPGPIARWRTSPTSSIRASRMFQLMDLPSKASICLQEIRQPRPCPAMKTSMVFLLMLSRLLMSLLLSIA